MRFGRDGSASLGDRGPRALWACGGIHGAGDEGEVAVVSAPEVSAGVEAVIAVAVEVALAVAVDVVVPIAVDVPVAVAVVVAVGPAIAVAALAVTAGAGAPPQPPTRPHPTRTWPTRRRVFPILKFR
jgi:hypothetical protein